MNIEDKLSALNAAALALCRVGNEPSISLGCGLEEDEVAAAATHFGTTVRQHVSVITEKAPAVLIYSFRTTVLGGSVEVCGQGSRYATEAEAREHGVRLYPDSQKLTGPDALALVKAA